MEAPLFKTLPDTHPVAWVQSEDSQQKWEGGGGGTAAKVAAVTGHCLHMFTCGNVACVCLLYNRAPQCQLFCFEFALFSHCVMIQFCEFLIKLLKSLLQQRAVNLFFI